MPAWRHALINYPHPLLKRGLVVLDTPGLNAIGAEPELTLALLPSAHATVFILGADTGVTKSDLAIWRDHLDGRALTRFVVLNKIDTLADPLLAPRRCASRSSSSAQHGARRSGRPRAACSRCRRARRWPARVAGDAAALAASRLPALEEALSAQLMPQRRAVIGRIVVDGMQAIEQQAARRLTDQRRQLAEQMLELRGLRGKSGGKVKLMLERVEAESAEFERCTARLSALQGGARAHAASEVMQRLSSDRVRDEVAQMREGQRASCSSWARARPSSRCASACAQC